MTIVYWYYSGSDSHYCGQIANHYNLPHETFSLRGSDSLWIVPGTCSDDPLVNLSLIPNS